jgi:hypothetical protein
MVQFTTDKEATIVIGEIVRRAKREGLINDGMALNMDLSATHVTCPLKLSELLASDRFNFAHDVRGIQNHINRKTGELEDFFCPRFAA